MVLILRKMWDTYRFISYDLCDERTRDFFPYPMFILTIIPFYIYFATNLGPRLMKDVKPFSLKTPIFYYNIIQIIFSAYIFYQTSWSWLFEYSWTCQPVDMTSNPSTIKMINIVWLYTIVKILDLMDTVFFVLRKKDRQISFLHVFHHAGMIAASYIYFKYYPNGHSTLIGYINSLVHVVMYTYYLISGLGPQYQKYLWWKKHLTTMQLIQFSIIFVHHLIPLFIECSFPKWISYVVCIGSLQFVYMFGNFYYVNYIKKAKKNNDYCSVKTVTSKTE